MFTSVVVSTDSEDIAEAARHYGAAVPFIRPHALATDDAPDIGWVRHALEELRRAGDIPDAFSILRPTSPFRTAGTIRRAWACFLADPGADSLRAVEPCTQHPGKMWRIAGSRLVPVLPVQPDGVPWHSQPTQSLPMVWVQNASLEIAWRRCVEEHGTIAGEAIVPFVTEGAEGIDINTPSDLARAEEIVTTGEAGLPPLDAAPWRP